ncbi:hypothetical protein KL948_005356, partial [Ogataea haglerorum]
EDVLVSEDSVPVIPEEVLVIPEDVVVIPEEALVVSEDVPVIPEDVPAIPEEALVVSEDVPAVSEDEKPGSPEVVVAVISDEEPETPEDDVVVISEDREPETPEDVVAVVPEDAVPEGPEEVPVSEDSAPVALVEVRDVAGVDSPAVPVEDAADSVEAPVATREDELEWVELVEVARPVDVSDDAPEVAALVAPVPVPLETSVAVFAELVETAEVACELD